MSDSNLRFGKDLPVKVNSLKPLMVARRGIREPVFLIGLQPNLRHLPGSRTTIMLMAWERANVIFPQVSGRRREADGKAERILRRVKKIYVNILLNRIPLLTDYGLKQPGIDFKKNSKEYVTKKMGMSVIANMTVAWTFRSSGISGLACPCYNGI